MKELELEAEHKPARCPNMRIPFLREWKLEQVPEYKDLTTFLRDSQSLAHKIIKELNELNSLKFQLSVKME